jgi:hypothetical protein
LSVERTPSSFSRVDRSSPAGAADLGRLRDRRAPRGREQSRPAATLIFGDWSSVLVCSWGVLEIGVNPFANFPAGIHGIRAIWSVDVIVRYAKSFCVSRSIT